MKADIFSLDGKKTGAIELPEQFNEDYEPDLVKRAIMVIEAAKRQSYGTMPKAGQGYSGKLSRRRRDYKGAYGKGISRVSRKTMWRRGMQFGWVGAISPGTTGGRRAHPPKGWKDWTQKINIKERKKAIRSALSGLVQTKNILVIDDKAIEINKLQDAKKMLTSLGLPTESVRKQKAGQGKNRGRAIKYKKNALLVVPKNCKLGSAISNIPGYDVINVNSVNAAVLTLGHNTPRKTIWTQDSIEKIRKEKLFQ